jgi:hypothetical protein
MSLSRRVGLKVTDCTDLLMQAMAVIVTLVSPYVSKTTQTAFSPDVDVPFSL